MTDIKPKRAHLIIPSLQSLKCPIRPADPQAVLREKDALQRRMEKLKHRGGQIEPKVPRKKRNKEANREVPSLPIKVV